MVNKKFSNKGLQMIWVPGSVVPKTTTVRNHTILTITVSWKFLKNETIVGHVPREISRYYCCALNSGGEMGAIQCRWKENKWGNGLEVPCKYVLKGPDTHV